MKFWIPPSRTCVINLECVQCFERISGAGVPPQIKSEFAIRVVMLDDVIVWLENDDFPALVEITIGIRPVAPHSDNAV